MDKNSIKTYAIWARNELRDRVFKKMDQYEITSDSNPDVDSVRGILLTKNEKIQRVKAIEKVKEKGIDQVVEEVAYTWFNRFSALRFMEVNNYLPTRIRVFTDENNTFNPQILTEAIHLELDGLDKEKIYELKEKNDNDELFKYLIITQCNALSNILPGMFQKISDYTELLFPDNLLREGSVIEQMISIIPEDDWTDQVQIIGWLYQYYITEQNELVYDGSWARERIKKELLPAATTIYTPDWSVKYMVQNSLGKLWLEGHPNDSLKSNWNYYLDETEQEPEVNSELVKIREAYSGINPEDILVIDPCQGSGHILCVLFDTLVSIYDTYGYSVRDSIRSIVEKNLWGLDIDDRAAQLAYFSVMMKARQYDSRFLVRKGENGQPDIPQPHIFGIKESNGIDSFAIDYYCDNRPQLTKAIQTILHEMTDAKEYGSILKVTPQNWALLYDRFRECENDVSMYSDIIKNELLPLVQVANSLAQKYHVVITNPPYLSNSRFSANLDKYVKEYYPDEKSDLSMVMLRKSLSDFSMKNCFVAFITTSSWLFLSSFEKVRTNMLSNMCIDSLVDYGTELFEGKVGHNPITAWVNRKSDIDYRPISVRLVDYCYSRRYEKESEFFEEHNRYYTSRDEIRKIPSMPIIYWASKKLLDIFNERKLAEIASPKQGIATADNNRFLRLWYECNYLDIFFNCHSHDESLKSQKKWYPYNKGGEFRKWYGNNDYVVNWKNDGDELRRFKKSVIRNPNYFFKKCISWSKISSGSIAFRYKPEGHIFDVAGTSVFSDDENLLYLHGLCNSVVSMSIFKAISPTLNYEVGHVASLPVIESQEKKSIVTTLVKENIRLSQEDWDSFEISWDFDCDPIVKKALNRNQWHSDGPITIESAYKLAAKDFDDRFLQLKKNEEELNRIFIDIYKLQEELTPEIEDGDVTVRLPEAERDIKCFISYAVGCMMGRYKYGGSGLEYAGGIWDASKYNYFPADEDGILPICDDEYFDDDIVGRFVDFVKTVFGAETLEENLKYIANSLGGSGSPREIIRNYFLNSFYTDHLKMYQKRPIFWLFDSGKKNGFKCLVYMHRYKPDTIARIRTDYVHEQQSRYRTAISGLERQIADASTSERVRLNKQLSTLKDQEEETRKYEEKIHHLADQMISINLDDGVKHNYEIFKDVLAKI